jgi:hypothetical protein
VPANTPPGSRRRPRGVPTLLRRSARAEARRVPPARTQRDAPPHTPLQPQLAEQLVESADIVVCDGSSLPRTVSGKAGPNTVIVPFAVYKFVGVVNAFWGHPYSSSPDASSVLSRIPLQLSTKARSLNPSVNVLAATNHVFDLSYRP